MHLSSKLSGVCRSALQGRDLAGGKGRIEVVDSSWVTAPLGLVAIGAARLAKSGASISGVLQDTRLSIARIHAWGMLDTLTSVFSCAAVGWARRARSSAASLP